MRALATLGDTSSNTSRSYCKCEKHLHRGPAMIVETSWYSARHPLKYPSSRMIPSGWSGTRKLEVRAGRHTEPLDGEDDLAESRRRQG